MTLSKRERELNQFFDTGSDEWMNAYYIYHARKKRIRYDVRTLASWFNKTLKRLQAKGYCTDMPFVILGGFKWVNPRRTGVKANYIVGTLEDANAAIQRKLTKVI